MPTVTDRLALLRKSLGLSLRETASILTETGYSVSHNAVHKYERGWKVPAEYVRAFGQAFGCRAEWLLSGQGFPLREERSLGHEIDAPFGSGSGTEHALRLDLVARANEERLHELRQEWERFLGAGRASEVLRPMIFRSWERSRAAGVEASGDADVQPRRLPPAEIEERLQRNRRMRDAAADAINWLCALHAGLWHVVYLVCRDGIVLDSMGEPEELTENWSLLPGHDWSEKTMGTNGAGTALVTGEPTVVLGPEHYVEGFHGCVCVAAPIVDQAGDIVGALDTTTTLDGADPRRLSVVAYAAETVSRILQESET